MKNIVNNKIKILIIFCVFALVSITIFLILKYTTSTNINKVYPAIILDVDKNTVVESTKLSIEGRGRKLLNFSSNEGKYTFEGRLEIDSIPYSLDHNIIMIELMFYERNKFNLWSAIYYMKYDYTTHSQELYTLGYAYLKNKNMDEIVIKLYSEEDPKDKKYLVAPANTLEEALNIYNDIMENNK